MSDIENLYVIIVKQEYHDYRNYCFHSLFLLKTGYKHVKLSVICVKITIIIDDYDNIGRNNMYCTICNKPG